MMKRLCMPLACLASLFLVSNVSAARTHGVDDADTFTLLHISDNEACTGRNAGAGGGGLRCALETSDPNTWTYYNPLSSEYILDNGSSWTTLVLDDDSNFPRPNENHGLLGTYNGVVGLSPDYRPDVDTTIFAPGIGSSASLLFDGGQYIVPGQKDKEFHDGVEITPNFLGFSQVNEITNFKTNAYTGLSGEFETQLYFRNDEINPNLDRDEFLIGAHGRWEIYAAHDGKDIAGALSAGSVYMTTWMDDGTVEFTICDGCYVPGDTAFNHLIAGYDQETATTYLSVNGTPAYTYFGDVAGTPRTGPLKADQAPISVGSKLPDTAFSGWIDEIQIWNTSSIPEPGSISLLILGLGLAGLRRSRA